MWFGFTLVIAGVLLLLNNLGILKGNSWDYIWPSAVILLGISILLKKNSPSKDSKSKGSDTRKED